MAVKTLSTTIAADSAGRVDLAVRDLVELSRSQVRGLVDHGCVTVNGVLCKNIGATVDAGDVVSVRFDPHQRYHEKKKTWEDRTFSVLYEDETLIVVDKSAGSLTVPTDNNEKNTLVERVSVYLSHSRGEREAWVVHRLDREVSGLLVFGKRKDIADALIEQFKQRKPERLYVAIVAGVMDRDEGQFRAHLATGNNLDRYITRPSADTEEAITHFRVLRRLRDTTLVELQLETGKRNQIRVQLADVGHPVLGDPRYQSRKAQHPKWIRKRIALHAKSLAFVHPASGETVTFESPLPSAMQKFVAGNR
ncbi:RluA family pseudouridine synthase [Novipirellula artificiosorum]|uniref:Pseudouridine synthase n=1 Tax=Novipirellula artificiosorum TaxID=2528016 RepID=A0A5C6DH02_9BACT|nr:RluA family pseudouridine synthase [Novipirellula artificiosorum]TWU36130.1 Ribosomal large subunit pseudouridine synthase D [Novipirellula artificiosorum]